MTKIIIKQKKWTLTKIKRKKNNKKLFKKIII